MSVPRILSNILWVNP